MGFFMQEYWNGLPCPPVWCKWLIHSTMPCAVLSHLVMSDSVHGDSPGKKIGVGCHALIQGIFPTQGSNPGIIAGRFFTIWATTEAHSTIPSGKPEIWIIILVCQFSVILRKIGFPLRIADKHCSVTKLCLTVQPHGLWHTRHAGKV